MNLITGICLISQGLNPENKEAPRGKNRFRIDINVFVAAACPAFDDTSKECRSEILEFIEIFHNRHHNQKRMGWYSPVVFIRKNFKEK